MSILSEEVPLGRRKYFTLFRTLTFDNKHLDLYEINASRSDLCCRDDLFDEPCDGITLLLAPISVFTKLYDKLMLRHYDLLFHREIQQSCRVKPY